MSSGMTQRERLDAHDRCASLHPIDRALALLALAGRGGADLADQPLARCDQELLRLRRDNFGDSMACLVDCPACGAPQEFDLSTEALLAGIALPPAGSVLVEIGGFRIGLRALTTRDLAAVVRAGRDDAEDTLALQVVTSVVGPDGVEHPQLPEHLLPAVSARVAQQEAETEIALSLGCADCGTQFESGFDVGQYLWTELAHGTRRLLIEIATLAIRFGWSEAELVAMSPARRRAYLDLSGAG